MFISPRIKAANYKNNILTNEPVNLSLCISVGKSRLKWYPDNTGIPSITFVFVGKETLDWVYNNESDRDADFSAISNNTYGKKI